MSDSPSGRHQRFLFFADHPQLSSGGASAVFIAALGFEIAGAPKIAAGLLAFSLFLFWAVFVKAGWFKSWPKRAGVGFGLIGLSFFLSWWILLPPTSPPTSSADEIASAIERRLNSGTKPQTTEPTFTDETKEMMIIMGGNGFAVNASDIKDGIPLTHVGVGDEDLPIFIKLRGGSLRVDLTLSNLACERVIELKDNKITLNIENWDRNMNNNALEVVDDHHNPMFQLIYERPSKVVINGIFCTSRGMLWSTDDNLISTLRGLPMPKSFKLMPIFKYPSWKYPGEFIER